MKKLAPIHKLGRTNPGTEEEKGAMSLRIAYIALITELTAIAPMTMCKALSSRANGPG